MKEEFALRSDGSVDLNDIDSVMGELGKAITRRVNFRRIKKPRSRRSLQVGPLGTLESDA